MEECASPCTCASGETSDVPLLTEPRGPSFRSLPTVDVAALEEGRHGAPLRACGLEGDGFRRGAFAMSGILAVIGLALLGAAAWSPADSPDRTSELSQHESPDVIGLNVIGVRPTTPAPPAEVPPQAPPRPPPDFPIEPPPGFYPDLPGAAEEEEAPPRPPPDFPIEPPPGFYPDLQGAATQLPPQAPLRPPPDFPIEPPPGFYPDLPAEGGVSLETAGSARRNPLLRSAKRVHPEGEADVAGRGPGDEEEGWIVDAKPADLQEPSAASPPTGGPTDAFSEAGALAARPAPARRIEDVRAADPSLLSRRLAGQAA